MFSPFCGVFFFFVFLGARFFGQGEDWMDVDGLDWIGLGRCSRLGIGMYVGVYSCLGPG